jgi:hypothetical protein
MQLQAGCAHFFVPAIPVLLIFRNLATFPKEQGSPDLADVEGRKRVFPESRHFSRETRLWIVSPIIRPMMGGMSRYDRPSHQVYMYFFLRSGWQVQFLEPDLKTHPSEKEAGRPCGVLRHGILFPNRRLYRDNLRLNP